MPLLIHCPGCNSKIHLEDHLIGKQISCPDCGKAIQIGNPGKPLPSRPSINLEGKAGADGDEREEDASVKKKGKKRAKKYDPSNDRDNSTLVLDLFAGFWLLVILGTLLFLTFKKGGNPMLKYNATLMLLMFPVTPVIFFAIYFPSNILLGEIELGRFPLSLFKVVFLGVLVNIALLMFSGIMPSITAWYYSFLLSYFAWYAGVISLFRMEVFEAGVIVTLNWIANFGAKMLMQTSLMPKIMSTPAEQAELINPITSILL